MRWTFERATPPRLGAARVDKDGRRFASGWGAALSVLMSLLVAAPVYLALQPHIPPHLPLAVAVAIVVAGSVVFSFGRTRLMRLREGVGGWREVGFTALVGSLGMLLYLIGLGGLSRP